MVTIDYVAVTLATCVILGLMPGRHARGQNWRTDLGCSAARILWQASWFGLAEGFEVRLRQGTRSL